MVINRSILCTCAHVFFGIVLNKDANKNNLMNFSLWDLIRDMMVPGVGMVSPVMVRSSVEVDSCIFLFNAG